jgi:hypothetical protein
VLSHRLKDGREPTSDELILELAEWNHQLDARQTLYEIHTVLELLIALMTVFTIM